MRRNHLARQRTSRLEMREFIRAGDDFSIGARPVLLKCPLQFRDERAFHPRMNISPAIRAISLPLPLIGKTDPAGKADFSVDHQDPPMGAPIQFIDPPAAGWMVIGE